MGNMSEAERPKHPGIYVIRCIANGRVYVGSSALVNARWMDHQRLLRRGRHHCLPLMNAWKKYGEAAFSFEIVEAVSDLERLVEREQFWMDRLRAHAAQRGFNVLPAAGSTRGYKQTAETRAKQSAAHKGLKMALTPEGRATLVENGKRVGRLANAPKSEAHKRSISLALKGRSPVLSDKWRAANAAAGKRRAGRSFSEEHRLAMSAAAKCVIRSEEHQRKLRLALAELNSRRKGRPLSEEHKRAIGDANRRAAAKRAARSII